MLARSDQVGGGASSPSLDSVLFDTVGYEFQGEPEPGKFRVWCTPEGDVLSLFFFESSDGRPAGVESADELASTYHDAASETGGRLVEVRVVEANGLPAVRAIISVPQQPSGLTYHGSLEIPFQNFGFVLNCECPERGDTGFKAAVLLARSLAAGQPLNQEGDSFQVPGFDPDAAEHDAEFPHDPVARARRTLDHLAASLVIADGVRRLPGFGPPPRPA
jgi:hypothetical protein